MEEEKKNNYEDINKLALKAGGWYVVSSVMLRAVNVLSTPIFTRLMSTEDLGVTATFNSWCSLLLVFCTLDLTYSTGRARLDYPDKLDDYIGSMQLLSLLVASVISICMIIFIEPLSNFFELPFIGVLLIVVYLVTMPAILFFQNGCKYRYRYKENVLITWITSIGSILISFFLIWGFDGNKAVYRMIGGIIPSATLSVYIWSKSLKDGHIVYNKEYWKYGLSLSAPLVLHEISLNVLSQADRIFIVKLCGLSAAGIYSVASNYGLLMSVVTGAVSQGWLPWFHDKYYAKEFGEIRENSKWIVILGCYVGLACIALAPEAVAILGGTDYAEGIYCIAPVTLGVVCQYIYTHYVNIEMHLKKTKFVPIGTVIAAIVNIMLNALFIPVFGYVAAAYTTFASYLILMLAHFLYTRFILKVKMYNDKFMFGAIAVTTIVAEILVVSYTSIFVRYALLCIGVISFLFVFRKFIIRYLKGIGKER